MAAAEVSEKAILEALRQVPRERWAEVLESLDKLHEPGGTGAADVAALAATTWTAAALRSWPRPVQDAILREQAASLVAAYLEDPECRHGVTGWTARGMAQLPVEQSDIILEAS